MKQSSSRSSNTAGTSGPDAATVSPVERIEGALQENFKKGNLSVSSSRTDLRPGPGRYQPFSSLLSSNITGFATPDTMASLPKKPSISKPCACDSTTPLNVTHGIWDRLEASRLTNGWKDWIKTNNGSGRCVRQRCRRLVGFHL